MKPKTNRFLAASMLALSSSAWSAQIYKDVTTTDINDVANWSTVSAAAIPNPSSIGTTDTLRFNEYFAPTSGTNYTASLTGDLTTGGIKLDSGSGSGGVAFGNVVINGTDTLTLNGTASVDSQYAGAVFVLNSSTGGTLTVNPDVLIGAAGTQIVSSRSLTLNGTLNWGTFGMSNNIAGGTTTVAGVVSGSGNWSKSGAGTYYFSNAANDFTGSVTVSGGTLRIEKLANGGDTSSLGSGSSAIILNGGTLTMAATGTGGSTDRAIDMRAAAAINNDSATNTISFTAGSVIQGGTASARTLTLGGSNGGDNTFNSILGNSGTGANISSLQKSGAGKWIVTGTQLYTGATIVNQGILSVSGSTVLGGATGSTVDAGNIVFGSSNSNGALQFETVANLGAADQIRFRNTGGTAGQGGALVYTGTTNQTLGKTLQSDSSIGIRIESNSVGGSLTLNGAFSQTNRPLFLGGTGTGDNTLSIAYNGTGVLTKRDVGTWLLGASNGYSGGTELLGGKLRVNALSGIGSGYLAVKGGSTFVYQGSGSESTTRTLFMDSGAATIEITNSSGSLTWNPGSGLRNQAFTKTGSGALELGGAITGSGSVSVSGGKLTLSGANTYNGVTSVTTGTLAIGASGSLANTTTTIGTGGTLTGGGSIGGTTTIQGTHSPGFSPGTQTFTNGLSYADTSTLVWELTGNTTGGRGSIYDAVDVSGGAFGLATGATIDIALSGSVDFLNSFWGTGQEWLVVDLLGSATAADSNLFDIGSITGGANWNPSLGAFGILRKDGSTAADSVYLTWTPVPEPAAALLGGMGLLVLLRRRRVG